MACKEKLIGLSFELCSQVSPNSKRFILDIDSTSHAQHGKKMEGVEFCYKKFRALDSIVAFDELGFQYWHDVRPGSTYTSNGSSQIIHEIFSRIPTGNREQRRIVRGDSGFSNVEFYNACAVKGAGFVCAAKRTDKFKERVARIKNWESQNPEKKGRILATGNRECEIGHTSYYSKGFSKPLRLVVIRAGEGRV
ncbi:MAG: transposase [Bdellovibrionota bacterium]